MRIWPNYEDGVHLFDELTLPEIDKLVDGLIELRKQGERVAENTEKAAAAHKETFGEDIGKAPIGVEGCYPCDESRLGEVEIEMSDHWRNSLPSKIRLRTKTAGSVKNDPLDMPLLASAAEIPESVCGEPDEREVECKHAGNFPKQGQTLWRVVGGKAMELVGGRCITELEAHKLLITKKPDEKQG